MTTTTAKGVPYPTTTDSNDVPRDIKAVADWITGAPGVAVLTTTQRDALTGSALWDGRVIVNTTTLQLERYVAATPGWVQAAITASSTDTLTNKTLTTPTINGAYTNASKMKAPEEIATIVASAPAAAQDINALTAGLTLFTANATANFVPNIRGDATTTLNSVLAVGESVTVSLLVTNGATPYYVSSVKVDGTTQTVKWAGGSAPASGNANSIDAYTITVIKTAASTYTVLGSTGRYA